MTDALLNYVLDAFKTHGPAPDLRGVITGLPGEALKERMDTRRPRPLERMRNDPNRQA